MQNDEKLEKLPRTSLLKASPADRRMRHRMLEEMKADRPVDEEQEKEYLDDLARRLGL